MKKKKKIIIKKGMLHPKHDKCEDCFNLGRDAERSLQNWRDEYGELEKINPPNKLTEDMNIDKDGKLGLLNRENYRIYEEFDWNVEEMADAIIDLRKEIKEREKNYEKEIAGLES